MEYKFKFCTLHSSENLTSEFLEEFSSGKCSVLKKNFKEFLERKNYDYYYAANYGPLSPESWKEFLGEDFLTFKKTLTQLAVELNVPRSLFRWYSQHSIKFKEFIESREYKHVIGKTLRSGVSYASQINKKSNLTRSISVSDKSYERALSLCKEFNLYPLFDESEWTGLRDTNGAPKEYVTKCKICGYEFKNIFSSSTIRVCPACKRTKYRSLREEEIAKYLESKGLVVLRSYRNLLKSKYNNLPQEVDLFLPERQIAIEFNGYFYHSSRSKPKNYHINKTKQAIAQGVSLFQFWEDESTESIKEFLDRVLQNKYVPILKEDIILAVDKYPDKKILESLNPSYEISWKEQVWWYTAKATSDHKSNRVFKGEKPNEDVEEIYTSGVWVCKKKSLFNKLAKDLGYKLLDNKIVTPKVIVCLHLLKNEDLTVIRALVPQKVQLVHVWEDDLRDRYDVVLWMLKFKLGLVKRKKLMARKCTIQKVEPRERIAFYNKYHIQGDGQGICYGLYYQGHLISCMSVRRGPSNTSSKGAWELNRYASIHNYFVVGGFEKLFKFFTKTYDIHHWISYADRTVSDGSLYEHQGWKKTQVSNPDYKYVYKGIRYHKFNFRIKRFREDKSLKFKEGLSEAQLAELNGITRIYDCGKIKYEKWV